MVKLEVVLVVAMGFFVCISARSLIRTGPGPVAQVVGCNSTSVPTGGEFEQHTEKALHRLVVRAPLNGSYDATACGPDVSLFAEATCGSFSATCAGCLRVLESAVLQICNAKIGGEGRRIFQGCSLRFQEYKFFDNCMIQLDRDGE